MDDNTEKLLYTLYAERNAKKPQMSAAAQSMGLAGEALGRAVNVLYTAGLISGVTVKFGEDDANPVAVATDDIILTRRGVALVDKALGLDDYSSAIQKLRAVIAKAAAPGWEGVKAIANKALQDHFQTG
ncbi:hypothetical protein [Anaeroselena agilis]|uniref:Uncharacterized protein n=1 Tax=Anaeroselena agilis TaxID=3063788 RepID=A0ABU3P3H5_9FIRM|nr:hypothetical protein [Selenomonadales bacterium 4137-cl]